MITKIRDGVFETNSSSTHAICIATNGKVAIPDGFTELIFEQGEFGWGYDTLNSIQEKASYLYTGLKYNSMDYELENIIELLKSNNIDVVCNDSYDGYVDHGNELSDFLRDVSSDETLLINYLFSDLSFILTGNDNGDGIESVDVGYEHVQYYKGN